MLDFCELNNIDFENSIVKNKFIQATYGEWLWFVDFSVTSREDIEPILKENAFLSEYDVVVFCSEELEGEIGLFDLLYNPQMVVYSFGVRRQLLTKTGSFNQLLEGATNYEFLLRVAEAGSVFAISCKAEKKAVFAPASMAYVMRRYMSVLKDAGVLEKVFLHLVQLAGCYGETESFNKKMNSYLQDSREYEQIVENTAPCLILVGNDVCAGVLAGFARSLADEMAALGQAVISTDNRYGNYKNIPTDVLFHQNYKAIIGFQTTVFAEEKFHKGKKLQFLFDNPIFYVDVFDKSSKEVLYLCQDAYYADFAKKYCNVSSAIQFPPVGTVIENLSFEKKYDVVFVGTYEPFAECIYDDDYKNDFFTYMIQHPDDTFEQGVYNLGKIRGEEYDNVEIFTNLQKLKKVCKDVLCSNRHHMIEKILMAGISLHVFSDSWELYHGKGRENLIIHPMLYGEEPYHVWAQSKIGLNFMRGHKAGMTERIANIMLCGACCLSDETVYLKEHFTDGEDIVLFKRSELDELPQKINYLLTHDEERERIAMAGRKKALNEHTWRQRAEQLLELLSNKRG